MSTAETVKAQLNALLNQANNTTGKTDTNLTAAIVSLAAGFVQGGGAQYQAGTLIGDGTADVVIPLEFEPDFLYIQLTDTDTTLDANHTVFGTIVRDYCYAASMRAANATNTMNGGSGFQISGLYGSNQNYATYENGILTWHLYPSGRTFYNGASYTWAVRKW